MTNIVEFPENTTVDQPPETVLERAKGWGMEACVVVGFDKDDNLQFGGSISSVADILLMLESAKMQLLSDSIKVNE